jgi:hypothetical protein
MSNMSGATPQRVTLTLTVDVDPVAFGFDLRTYEAEEIVTRAINSTMGLEIAESYSVVTP